jgi:hypothetical protein
MSKARAIIRLSLDERLRESERSATSMSLPAALVHRLNLLADEAKDIDATRSEIIGMLLAQAELGNENLELDILRYRKLKVADVVPAAEKTSSDNVISISPRGPGRPAKSGNQ